MTRLTKISTEYHAEIGEAASRFGDHEDVSEGRIANWMKQFDDGDLNLASRVLKKIRYYAASNIRSMTRELCQMILEDHSETPASRVAFVAAGDPGSSSEIIHRVLRDVPATRKCRKMRMTDLVNLKEGDVSVLVLLDDFSGTGKQMSDWWANIETLVRPLNALVIVAVLALNKEAEDAILEFADECFHVDYFNDDANVFSGHNRDFSDGDRKMIEEYCNRTNCKPAFRKGFGECGLLVAFKHGCPNNSLPILWWNQDGWVPLFKRSAI
jgi:hypothetical protein